MQHDFADLPGPLARPRWLKTRQCNVTYLSGSADTPPSSVPSYWLTTSVSSTKHIFWLPQLSLDLLSKHSCLTLMPLGADLANTKWCKKTKKWPKPWHMGSHLRVLSESYPINTKMTGFRTPDERSLSIGRVKTIEILCNHKIVPGVSWISRLLYAIPQIISVMFARALTDVPILGEYVKFTFLCFSWRLKLPKSYIIKVFELRRIQACTQTHTFSGHSWCTWKPSLHLFAFTSFYFELEL